MVAIGSSLPRRMLSYDRALGVQVPDGSEDVSVSFRWNDEGSLSVEHLGNGSNGAAPQVCPLTAHQCPVEIFHLGAGPAVRQR